MNKGFGCLEETPSCRLYRYGAFEALTGANKEIELPEEYILPEEYLPKVTDQGNTSACCAFAAAEILSVLHGREFGEKEAFSEGFIYGYNRNDEATYEGMYPSDLMKKLCIRGSVPKTYYSELFEMPGMREVLLSHPSIEKLAGLAEKYRLSGYVGFLRGEKDEMKRAIYTHKCPLFGVSRSYFGGSHAIIVIGWDKDGFIIQNSWGRDWGDGGRAGVPLDAVNSAYLLIDEEFDMGFHDVKKDAWYYDDVKEACFNGLMQGTSAETFEPDRAPTRAEMAAFGNNILRKLDEILKIREEMA